jgi:ketosteroid isomerase-like protein
MASDEPAVTRVLFAYCYAVDALDVEAAVALFTEGCTFDWGHGRVARGHDGIRSLLGALTRWQATSHHLSNVVVDPVDEHTVRASSYVYAWHQVADTGAVEQLWGRYHDRLVREADGRWRFAERTLRSAGESGFPASDDGRANFERLARPGPGLA